MPVRRAARTDEAGDVNSWRQGCHEQMAGVAAVPASKKPVSATAGKLFERIGLDRRALLRLSLINLI
jgi:hypothetical protein